MILLLSEIFPPAKGGSGRWMWELHRRLAGCEVTVVAGRQRGDAEFDATSGLRTDRLELRFASWGLSNLRSGAQYIRAAIALRRIIARVRPQMIHCGKCLPEGLLAAWLQRWRGIPFRCFVHGEELTLAGTSRELRKLTAIVLNRAQSVIANSDHTRKLLMDEWQVAGDRVVVLHPGVDTARFVPARCDAAVRGRLGWINRRIILTVGALQKRKGQDMMIRALPQIRAACPDVLYSVVGEGWERPYLEALVDEHQVRDVVQFRATPPDDELIECYQQCDLFALPNRRIGWDFEGFGIVLLEAQACGRPVLAGNSGGTSETMLPTVTGGVVDCETPEPLARAVIALLNSPEQRQAMGAAAREWSIRQFDWGTITDQARKAFNGRCHGYS